MTGLRRHITTEKRPVLLSADQSAVAGRAIYNNLFSTAYSVRSALVFRPIFVMIRAL